MSTQCAVLATKTFFAEKFFSCRRFSNRNAVDCLEALWRKTCGPSWTRSIVSVVAITLLNALAVAGQAQTLLPTWSQQTPATSPAARSNQVMAFDSAHGQVVLFGGADASDTWLWNGTTWSMATPSTPPPPRSASAMAYDSARGQVVMFGGIVPGSATNRLGDTWLWDGTNWTQANPSPSPSARDGAAMVYDPVHGQTVLFGGIDNSGTPLNDTWVWNGTTWTNATPASAANSPTARFSVGMAWDAGTSSVLLFGGLYSGDMADTWVWNGTIWTQRQPQNFPSARDSMGMAYDAALGEVVLFGGIDNGTYLNDTWLWSGTNWTQYAPSASPSIREFNEDMVYDAARDQMMFFGGVDYATSIVYGDTWEFGLPGNFGNVNVCPSGATTPSPCSKTVSFTYTVTTPVTFRTPQVLTQGTSGLDFTLNTTGTSCTGFFTGGTCTVSVTFAPPAPGSRIGSIQLTGLLDNNSTVVTNTPIYGVGQGPAETIGQGLQNSVNTTANYPLSTPKGVTVDAAGEIFISDTTKHEVVKVAANGTVSTVGVGLNYPQGMAVDGAGDVFIADNSLNQVIEVPAGCAIASCQTTVGIGLQSQLGVAVDGLGDVFISDFNDHEVVEVPVGCVTAACQVVVYSPGITSNPVGVAADAAGNVFVADYGLAQVVKIPTGCTTAACQTKIGGGWSQPVGVAVDAAGDVFVADEGNQVISQIPAHCAIAGCQSTFVTDTTTVAVALDSAGNIYYPDFASGVMNEVNRGAPQSYGFQNTTVGSASTPLSFTFQNVGNQPLNAESPGLLTLTSPSFVNVPGNIAQTPDCSASATLVPGQQCNLSVSFEPQSVSSQLLGSAVFTDNALNAASATQSLFFNGVGLARSYTISGSVSGLTGTGLVLQDNLSSNLPVSGNGAFTFAVPVAIGSPFSVSVLTPPTGQTCAVVSGSGIVQAANVTTVQVNCTNLVNYALTVTTPGMGTGTVTSILGQISCVGANGGSTGTCSGVYPAGTLVSLTATASTPSVFVGWGGACSSSGASALCVVTMNAALSVSASFVAPPTTQAATIAPITAGAVYGQLGSFTTNGTKENGAFSANTLFDPDGLAVDTSGNLYVSDQQNSRVLFYPAGSTTATRIYGQSGDYTSNVANSGGLSANTLSGPYGIALDSGGGLYVADYGNNRVLFYPSGSTTASRVYGQGGSFTSNAANNGGISASSLHQPTAVTLDSSGNLYVVDQYNNRVLFYPSGTTTATKVYGQGGSFSTVNTGSGVNGLNFPVAAALDSSGDLYVSDGNNNRVLFYPNNSTTATQVYGQFGSFTSNAANTGGISANSLQNPAGLTVDSSGNLYVADANNRRLLFYPFGTTTATRVYGQGGSFTSNAASGISANSLSQVWVPALDSNGNLYVADLGNNRVLEFGSFGNVNACPSGQATPAPCSNTVTYSYAPAITTAIGAAQVVTQGVTGLDFAIGNGSICAGIIVAGSSCTVNVNFTPTAPGLRTGALQLYDITGNMVANQSIYGVGLEPWVAFGPGIQTTLALTGLAKPDGVAVDASGNTYVADYVDGVVLKYSPTGAQTTVPFTGLSAPAGVAVDGAGNLFVVDLNLPYAVKLTPNGVQSNVGSGLSFPIGVAVDGAGDVYVGDQNNNRVIEVTPSGVQTTVPTTGLNQTWGVAVDARGDVFIADGGNSRVIEVTPGGVQTTVAATGLSQPYGVAVDAAGDVYIADPINMRVVEVPAGGGPQINVGSGLNYPSGVAVDGAGDVLIGDQGNAEVFKVNRFTPPSIGFPTTNVGSTNAGGPAAFTVQNIGNQPLTGSLALNLAGGSFVQTAASVCSTAFPLAPGAMCGEGFAFMPQSATFFSGSAVFTDSNLNSSPLGTQTIPIYGIGSANGVAGTVAVPNVVGQATISANAPIAAVGLAMGTVTSESSSSVASGSIISQSPVAGTQVAVGSTVNLLVSTGIATPPSPNPLSLNNNYFLTGDYVSAGVTMRGTGKSGIATGTITIPSYTQSTTLGIPDGADIIDAFLYWQTLESTPLASSTSGTFNGYPIVGQQIGNDVPNYVDGAFTGTIRSYRADVNIYLPSAASGIRFAAGNYTISLPDSGGGALPLTEGASLVMIYRVLSPNFPLKSVVIYDGAGQPTAGATQVVQGFYDAVGGASGTGKSTNLFALNGSWNTSLNSVTLGQSNQYSAPLNPAAAYSAVILSTPVNNSDNDGILDAWKTGPTAAGDFHAGQPGYYDVKTNTWVGLPGALHGKKDLFVQLDYMCGALLASGSCDPNQENLFPSPDANGVDPLALVQQAFAQVGVVLHLQIGNAIPEDNCADNLGATPAQLCQFPNQPGVIGWKNSLEFSKLYPRNLGACLTGGDCTTRFPYGQKDSYHYVLVGHSLAIPAYNSRYGTLTSINVANGITTLGTVDRGAGTGACPSRLTIEGVLGNPALNGVYNTTRCADSMHITLATPGVPNWSYSSSTTTEPVIGITFGQTTSISGYSDLGGADSAVTLGQWLTYPHQDMSKRANVLAGTLFHEIGHTLGLSHGGLYYDTPNSYVPTYEANCKPNYQSIMNYLFQLDGVGPNQAVAFSNQALETLNETTAGSLTELTDVLNAAASFPTSAWYVPYTTGTPASPATLHCDGTPLAGESIYRVDAPISPIAPPWLNGQDLNGIGALQSEERGFNDVNGMDLRQVGATGGEFASLSTQLSFGPSIAPLNITAGGTVTLGSGGTVALGSGGTVMLGNGGTVTLGSGGVVTLGSGGTVTLGSGGVVTLGSGGTVTPGSGGVVALGSGRVTLSSGGVVTLGSGGTLSIPGAGTVTLGGAGVVALGSGRTTTVSSSGGVVLIDSSGGVVTLGSGGTVMLSSGGVVTLGSGGIVALGSGGTVTLGSMGVVTLGSGGIVTLGSGGTVALGSGGTVTLGSGGIVALGSGGTVTLGSGGVVTLGSGGTVTLGSGGASSGAGGVVTLGSGGEATLGAGGTVTLGSGGTVALGSGGVVTLGSGGVVALGSGGIVALGSGGTATLSMGGVVTLGSGGSITLASGGVVTLGSGGIVTLGSGGTPTPESAGTYTLQSGGVVAFGSGGVVTLGSGGVVTLGSGGSIALGSGGVVTLGSGGVVTLGSGGVVTLGSGGVVTLGSGGVVTLGSGGVVTLGSGGSVIQGTGSDISLGSVNNVTSGSGGPTSTELTYETANSVVRAPTAPTETVVSEGVRINWNAPAFGVVQTYTIYRSADGATPIVIGSVSGVNGFPPATTFLDTNPAQGATNVVYTITTTLVPDTGGGAPRQSLPSAPAVVKYDQSIMLGPLPSSVLITSPLIVAATAMSNGVANGLLVAFSATGSCAIGSQTIASGVTSATVTFSTTGSCTVTASQSGTNAFNAANSVSGSFMVLPQGSATQSQMITNFATLPNVQYGSTFSLSPAVSTSGQPVTFMASGHCMTNGMITGVGICSITASAAATTTYSAASLTQSFTVYPAVLKVTANSFSITSGQAIPSLTYGYSGFVNGETAAVVSGAPALSTTATVTSGAGNYPITVSTGTLDTANYSFLYVSGTLTITAGNQAPLILKATSPLTYGQSETLSVMGGTTGGAVIYSLTPGPCGILGATLTANNGTGSCQVTATMAGNSNYNSVTSSPATVMLERASQTINFTISPPASAVYNSSFKVAATSTSGGVVTFTTTPSGACSNSGATFTMTSSTGTCSVIANQAGNLNYAAAPQVTKTVTATGPSLTVSPSSINFGTVYQGSISAQVITVANVGTAAATINDPILSIVKGGNSNEFVALSLCPKSLAAGKSCTVLIGFIAGPYYTPQTATLQIMDNAPGGPHAVAMSATVIDPVASFSPNSLNFGTIKHATSSSMNVVLSNTGATPLTLPSFSITGANAAYFAQTHTCGSSLAAGASCTIAIKFTPAIAGSFNANLAIVDNAQAGGGTQTVALSGKGN